MDSALSPAYFSVKASVWMTGPLGGSVVLAPCMPTNGRKTEPHSSSLDDGGQPHPRPMAAGAWNCRPTRTDDDISLFDPIRSVDPVFVLRCLAHHTFLAPPTASPAAPASPLSILRLSPQAFLGQVVKRLVPCPHGRRVPACTQMPRLHPLLQVTLRLTLSILHLWLSKICSSCSILLALLTSHQPFS